MTSNGDKILFEYRHSLQQFHSAVASLATGPGDVRSRLRCAWFGSLMDVKIEDLPESLQREFTYIYKRLHRINEEFKGQIEHLSRMEKADPMYKEKHLNQYPHPVEATLGRIRNTTGVEIALSIYNIHESLADMCSNHEKRPKAIPHSLSNVLPFDLSKYRDNIDK